MKNQDTLKPRRVLTLTEAELRRELQKHFRRFVSRVEFQINDKGEVHAIDVEFFEHPPTTF